MMHFFSHKSLLTGWFIFSAVFCIILLGSAPDFSAAQYLGKVAQYKDTITSSAPGAAANHTFSFTTQTNLSPGSYFELVPAAGFEIIGSSTFSALRNIELRVNGIRRDLGPALDFTDDFAQIVPGSPGLIRYTLNTGTGISSGDVLEFRIGNHTSLSRTAPFTYVDVILGTTTIPADIKPIKNSLIPDTYRMNLRMFDGTEVGGAGFVISVISSVGVGVDTTETVPPLRFNGAPSGTLPGTTFSVELSVETEELAICKYSKVASTTYDLMPFQFSNTGILVHTTVLGVTPGSVQNIYVRCMDDEFNKNIDDYLIYFVVSSPPTGISSPTGSTTGNGSGTAASGTGTGTGPSGGVSGGGGGQNPTTGGSSGSGGSSGGGGGGGAGSNNGSQGGGGFESTDSPYRSGDGQVTISGSTAPRSQIFIGVDGKLAKTGTADSSGEYSIVLDLIARGVYTFGVYSVDAAKVKTSTFSTSFTVTGARASALSNITLPPSISASPNPVTPGQPITISGYSIPNATITVENEKAGTASSRKQFTAQANSNGAWSLVIDSNGLSTGSYKARAKAQPSTGQATGFSSYASYGVGQASNQPLNADLSRDGKVNLTDFSILLFWWNSNGGDSDPPADINSDGKVNLTDFSILLFNWTG